MSTDDLTAKSSPSSAKTWRTDDLIRRAREAIAPATPQTPFIDINALVSELADEVDRLRAEADRFPTLWDRHGKNDLLAERDAARAALERVGVLADTPHAWVLIRDITRALRREVRTESVYDTRDRLLELADTWPRVG